MTQKKVDFFLLVLFTPQAQMTVVTALFMIPTAIIFPTLLKRANVPPPSSTLKRQRRLRRWLKGFRDQRPCEDDAIAQSLVDREKADFAHLLTQRTYLPRRAQHEISYSGARKGEDCVVADLNNDTWSSKRRSTCLSIRLLKLALVAPEFSCERCIDRQSGTSRLLLQERWQAQTWLNGTSKWRTSTFQKIPSLNPHSPRKLRPSCHPRMS